MPGCGWRGRAGPGDLKDELVPNKQFGMARDVYSQRVCAVAARFREALFFQLQAPVGFVQRHTELMWPRRKRVLEKQRLAPSPLGQICREEQFAIREHDH